MRFRKILSSLSIVIVVAILTGCGAAQAAPAPAKQETEAAAETATEAAAETATEAAAETATEATTEAAAETATEATTEAATEAVVIVFEEEEYTFIYLGDNMFRVIGPEREINFEIPLDPLPPGRYDYEEVDPFFQAPIDVLSII